jgi:SPP1 gp7 family putative phage head morphogenesis protein
MRELLSLEDAALARLLGPYREARAELTQRLLELEGLGQGETFGAQRLALMRAQLAAVLAVAEGRQQEELRQALEQALATGGTQQIAELADLEARFGSLATSELVALIQPVIPAAASAALADASSLLISRFRNEVQYGVSQALAQSVVQGEGIAQAARRLGRTMEGERWRLERIARTEIGNAMNAGHQASIEQVANRFPEMGLQKQWSAHLDGRTSRRCRGLHLQVRETTQLFTARDGWQGSAPPAHPNCRSRVVAYSSRWERGRPQRIAEEAVGTARNPVSSSAPNAADVVSAARSNRARGVATVNAGQSSNNDEFSIQRGVHFGSVIAGETLDAAQRRSIWRSHSPLLIDGFLKKYPFGDVVFTDVVVKLGTGYSRGWYNRADKSITLLERWPKGSFGIAFEPGKCKLVAELGADQVEVLKRTFVHELAHHVHRSLGSEFAGELYEAHSAAADKAISIAAATSTNEYFAETLTAYRFEPAVLQEIDPKGYDLVERILRRVRELGAEP